MVEEPSGPYAEEISSKASLQISPSPHLTRSALLYVAQPAQLGNALQAPQVEVVEALVQLVEEEGVEEVVHMLGGKGRRGHADLALDVGDVGEEGAHPAAV